MILLEVREYLRTHRRVELRDLTYRFGMAPDALRAIVQKWVDKGRVEAVAARSECASGCHRCDVPVAETYVWKD
jgi:hypothetical protein